MTQTPEAIIRFLRLVQIVHGPPKEQFKATQADASRMVRSFFNADTEGEVVQQILADQKGAWSLFRVCLIRSGYSAESLRAAPVVLLNRENMGRAMPFLTLAVPAHKYE